VKHWTNWPQKHEQCDPDSRDLIDPQRRGRRRRIIIGRPEWWQNVFIAGIKGNLSRMLLIDNNGATDPTINLALEEYCYRSLDHRRDYVLFYINQPSIIIGNHQNPFQEVNFELAVRNKIRPVRRISGGGAVYHDPGNLNFSFITKFTGEMLNYFKTLLQPVLKTLQRLGLPAQLAEKNNITVAGKKISGNSQHTDMRRMLSHGTLLFDADLDVLHHVLAAKQDIIHSRAVASIPGRVTNISRHLSHPLDMEAFLAELIGGISKSFGELAKHQLSAADWDAVCRLSKEKYQSWDWTFGKSPEFTVVHKVRSESTDVQALISVKQGIIQNIRFPRNRLQPQAVRRALDEYIGKRYGFGEINELLY
jgi:lipoate---protein ligase